MIAGPRLVRWGGFAGSVATAGTAYLGGSGFARVPSINPGTLLSGQRGVLLPVLWVLGMALLITAWWVGRHAVPSTRWALLTAGLWFLPVLPFLPLGSADVYSYACQGFVQHAGGDPYAAGVGGSGCPWLGSVATSWVDSPAPYGPLFLMLAARVVAVAGESLTGVVAGLRIVALAGVALLAVAVPALARSRGADPARATWLVLACPLVLIHLVSGAHNDAVMAGLIVAGLVLAAAAQPETPGSARLVLAGVVLGLAVGVKATAIVVVPFAVLAALPGPDRRLRELWRPAVAVGGGLVLATVALAGLSGRGAGWVTGLLRSGDTVTWGSPPTAVGLVVEAVTGLPAVPVTRLIGVVVLAVVLVLLWWRARRGDAITGAGLALAATVLCAPVFHPWYATWPLAVLAAVRAEHRWLLGLCAFAATLTTPAGYNWALYTRVPGAFVVTAALVTAVVVAVRRRVDRRVVA
ncbi:alpha-1,6-mannosyltransferase [Pseudosporangium ferrugineum]|uniref:Alpha-1,6-mannosyltransferase n=1 Tax=Pseudosporangium ferrugineum TaxID=439699 RepID=A0A2T0S9X2_9ACTN|nr:polyprenol phosphomannose-dependent alpha 1,6 mannosyltransferase MptB [Pseudosporangium ferrugineum]PRY30224.1 alpha-1,6-mannosyltransferase [Pseudosporangium ferrugineum]